ncbi:MAG: hypothetical protein MJ223_00075 [Mycoplasmoidaceae bacterium]|nr:hypothetical protein [Mycoplasmoidaceae bacterium]
MKRSSGAMFKKQKIAKGTFFKTFGRMLSLFKGQRAVLIVTVVLSLIESIFICSTTLITGILYNKYIFNSDLIKQE